MQPESAPAATAKLGGLRENLLGAIAYITFLPALVFVLRDPFRKNPFVRFHSVQCLLFWLVGAVLVVVARLLTLALLFVPVLGPMLAVLVAAIAALAVLFTWIVLVIKAYQGEKFELPLIGAYADQYSGNM